MNQYSQQSGNYQGQQGFQNQVPTGYVQSHYQGQLSQPTFGRQTNSIVSNQPGGYQATNSYSQGTQHFIPTSYTSMSQPTGNNYAYTSHQPVQSHAQSPAAAFGNVGPVIAHTGYQAGQDRQQSFYQPATAHFGNQYAQHATSNFGGSMQSNIQGAYGPTPMHSYTNSPHPVYDATNAYQQSGPVISHVGWQSSTTTSPYSGNSR
ncbi:hypothetical protein L1N85_00275 [Paenibacillus alkaliterrae]|uniref:hypothetical protein n=1 Tax=Paenibacillus alkaliterrae TaxID=320909 RepID=UPI001F3FE4C7|nr:hypothetical protein [Paenibacillus alkaliterrae]MCF2936862.1 hypothetical protein [Paenibacillus alkaliterrae]